MPAKNRSNEIKLSRLLEAPVDAVWSAWTDLEQVSQWWGPRGFTITTHSKDLRPGGTWDYTMHGPDGVDYPNTTTYHEVIPGKKLVYDHGASHDRPPLFRVTVAFTPLGERTQMDLTMTLATPEAAEEIGKFIKKAGGNATWDRLSEHLVKGGTGKEKFIINRTFEAPLSLVSKMWSDPKHLSQWLAPTGSTMEIIKGEIKAGDQVFFRMSGTGPTLYGNIRYFEINTDRIVYAQQFCDAAGNISRHPMVPVWPETMMTMVTFVEEAPERTRVTLTWEPAEGTTSEELRAFVEMKGNMTLGWTGSFDKLEDLLDHTEF